MATSKRLRGWLHTNRSRISVAVILFFLTLPTLIELPYTLERQSYTVVFAVTSVIGFTTYYLLVFIIAEALLIMAAWYLEDFFSAGATALGFSRGISLQVSGEGHVITLPTADEAVVGGDAQIITSRERYDKLNSLSPLDIARLRILDHVATLRNNAIVNLFIGIGIAVIGVGILATSIFQLNTFYDQTKHSFDGTNFLLLAVAPKLSVTVFVQVFAYFFLAMYRSNQTDIRYYQNELTRIDSMAASLILATGGNNLVNIKIILTELAKNERNRVMKKGERPISASDEAEFMKALSTLLDIKLGAGQKTGS